MQTQIQNTDRDTEQTQIQILWRRQCT